MPLFRIALSQEEISNASTSMNNYMLEKILEMHATERVGDAQFIRPISGGKGFIRFQYLTRIKLVATGLITYEQIRSNIKFHVKWS